MSDVAPSPRSRKPIGVKAALALLLLVGVVVGGWFAVHRNTAPDAQMGRAWLDNFAVQLTSPGLLGARGPSALALFPRLGTWPASGCQAEWRKADGLGPVILSQSLELARLDADPCEQAQFGQLGTVLRQSEGVTPGALAERLTERFGAPQVHRDTSVDGSITYEWDVLYGIHIRMEEPVGLAGADTFSVMVTRFLGASGGLPSPADAERWLDRTAALLTGPDLSAAHGMQAVRLVDAAMPPEATLGGGCATSYATSGAAPREAIAYDKRLTLDTAAPDCDDAGFEHLSLTIWTQGPVTVQALVERVTAKLGPPALNRDFARHSLHYEWNNGLGTTVGVTETVGASERIFFASLGRR